MMQTIRVDLIENPACMTEMAASNTMKMNSHPSHRHYNQHTSHRKGALDIFDDWLAVRDRGSKVAGQNTLM